MRFRVRFSLLMLLLLPLAFALGLIVVDRTWISTTSQTGSELVVVVVQDAETGIPISDATVRSSVADRGAESKKTNNNGEAAFASSYSYEHHDSLLREWRDHKPACQVAVSASDYKPTEFSLETVRGNKTKGYGLPYPIVVLLARSSSNRTSEVNPTQNYASAESQPDSESAASSADDPFAEGNQSK